MVGTAAEAIITRILLSTVSATRISAEPEFQTTEIVADAMLEVNWTSDEVDSLFPQERKGQCGIL